MYQDLFRGINPAAALRPGENLLFLKKKSVFLVDFEAFSKLLVSAWAFGGNRFDISRNSSLKAFPASSGCSSILAEKWNLCELTEREEFVWLRVWSKGNSSPNGARVNFAKLLLKFWSFFPRWSHLPPFYGRWVSQQKYWYFLAGVHVRIYLVNCLSLL